MRARHAEVFGADFVREVEFQHARAVHVAKRPADGRKRPVVVAAAKDRALLDGVEFGAPLLGDFNEAPLRVLARLFLDGFFELKPERRGVLPRDVAQAVGDLLREALREVFDRARAREGVLRRDDHFVGIHPERGAVADRALREGVARADEVARGGRTVRARHEVGTDREVRHVVGFERHVKIKVARIRGALFPLLSGRVVVSQVHDDVVVARKRHAFDRLRVERHSLAKDRGSSRSPRKAVRLAALELFLDVVETVFGDGVRHVKARPLVVVEVVEALPLERVEGGHRHGDGRLFFLRAGVFRGLGGLRGLGATTRVERGERARAPRQKEKRGGKESQSDGKAHVWPQSKKR